MSETEVTREQLLASVHTLQPGDLLIVRLKRHASSDEVQRLADELREGVKDTSIRILVLSEDLAVEVVRPGEDAPSKQAQAIAEAVAEATANPGRIVQTKDPA